MLKNQLPKYYLFSPRKSKNLLISLSIFGLIVITYTFFWYGMNLYLKNTIADLKGHGTKNGIFVSYDKLAITGYPLNLRIGITDFQLQIPFGVIQHEKPGERKKWIWQAQRAVVKVRPWNFNSVKLDISGSNNLSIRNGVVIYNFESEAELIDVDVKISHFPRLEKIKINARGIKIAEKLSKIETAIDSVFFSTQHSLQGKIGHSEVKKNPSRILQVKLKGIYLPKTVNLPIGNHLEKLFMNLRIVGELDPILSSHNLETWRDAGGIIDIDSFEGNSDSLKSHGAGTLALDQNLQPLLAMTINFKGIMPFVDKLKASGFIRSNTALLAKVILRGISKRYPSGKRGISLPLTIQDRKVSVGPVPIMNLPSINWDKRSLGDN